MLLLISHHVFISDCSSALSRMMLRHTIKPIVDLKQLTFTLPLQS